MDFIPYKINECLENVFYQIPKELFENPYYKNLSSESKLLYALLLDRLMFPLTTSDILNVPCLELDSRSDPTI